MRNATWHAEASSIGARAGRFNSEAVVSSQQAGNTSARRSRRCLVLLYHCRFSPDFGDPACRKILALRQRCTHATFIPGAMKVRAAVEIPQMRARPFYEIRGVAAGIGH
jgi:hypothetical protein